MDKVKKKSKLRWVLSALIIAVSGSISLMGFVGLPTNHLEGMGEAIYGKITSRVEDPKGRRWYRLDIAYNESLRRIDKALRSHAQPWLGNKSLTVNYLMLMDESGEKRQFGFSKHDFGSHGTPPAILLEIMREAHESNWKGWEKLPGKPYRLR